MKIKFQPRNISAKFELSVLAYFFCAFYIYQLLQRIEPCVVKKMPFQVGWLVDLAIYPAFYVLSNLVFFLIIRKHIVLRAIIAVFLGVILSIVRFIEAPGIIDPVHFFILSASCAGVLGLYRGDYFSETLIGIQEFNDITEKLIDYIRDGYKYLLGKAFQGWLALGASLGVSMSILFRGGYEDVHLKFMALKMLVGFIAISGAVGRWVAIPMLNGMVNIQEHLRSVKFAKLSKLAESIITG
jgi:hypothetical protein